MEGLFQPVHLLVIVGVALFVFGPQKLPELGKGFSVAEAQTACNARLNTSVIPRLTPEDHPVCGW
jgi:Sec-independent protein translocase protein TatA